MSEVVKAKQGEKCACGQPAKAALVTMLGRVPTCKTPEDYASDVLRHQQLAQQGLMPSGGQSGAR